MQSWGGLGVSPPPPGGGFNLMFFKDREISQDYDDAGPLCGVLDGASLAVNHSEFVWPPFHKLCTALRPQLQHVYVNCYVTPPGSQAVRPHTDDRDVFILQLCGQKAWKVYGNPPVKFPYTNEEVGKAQPVPEEVFSEGPVIDRVLCPGDVLYMPRGYVHEARCSDSSSWHATVAVATHDWSWSKIYASTIMKTLDATADARWRRPVPLHMRKTGNTNVEDELSDLVTFLHDSVTVPLMADVLANRLEPHNNNQDEMAAGFQKAKELAFHAGPDAECRAAYAFRQWGVGLSTRVRKLKAEEKARARRNIPRRHCAVSSADGKPRRGLMIRNEISGVATAVLGEVERAADKGVLVKNVLQSAVCRKEPLFDEFVGICFARACIAGGAWGVAPQSLGADSRKAAGSENVIVI